MTFERRHRGTTDNVVDLSFMLAAFLTAEGLARCELPASGNVCRCKLAGYTGRSSPQKEILRRADSPKEQVSGKGDKPVESAVGGKGRGSLNQRHCACCDCMGMKCFFAIRSSAETRVIYNLPNRFSRYVI